MPVRVIWPAVMSRTAREARPPYRPVKRPMARGRAAAAGRLSRPMTGWKTTPTASIRPSHSARVVAREMGARILISQTKLFRPRLEPFFRPSLTWPSEPFMPARINSSPAPGQPRPAPSGWIYGATGAGPFSLAGGHIG